MECVGNRLSGRRTLMIVSRDSVLDDVMHCMSKPGFSPITVRITLRERMSMIT